MIRPPGPHVTHAEYFREHGPDAFFEAAGYPPVRLPEPEQIRGPGRGPGPEHFRWQDGRPNFN